MWLGDHFYVDWAQKIAVVISIHRSIDWRRDSQRFVVDISLNSSYFHYEERTVIDCAIFILDRYSSTVLNGTSICRHIWLDYIFTSRRGAPHFALKDL